MDIPMNPLTHVDVEQQTFHASFRGYAEDEVDQFLDDVVTSLRTLHQMVADRDQRIVALASGDSPSDPSQAVSGALIEAQKSADRIVSDARAEAAELASISAPTISPEQRAEYEADVAKHAMLKSELATLQATLSSIAGAAAAAAGGAVPATGSALGEVQPIAPGFEPMAETAADPDVQPEAEVEAEVIEEHDEPEIGLVGFVDPVSLTDEEATPPNLYEIPAAVQQAEERFGGTRLSEVLQAAPDPVVSDTSSSENSDEEASKEAPRRPWERG